MLHFIAGDALKFNKEDVKKLMNEAKHKKGGVSLGGPSFTIKSKVLTQEGTPEARKKSRQDKVQPVAEKSSAADASLNPDLTGDKASPRPSGVKKPANAEEVLQRCERVFHPESIIKEKGLDEADDEALAQILRSVTLLHASRRLKREAFERAAKEHEMSAGLLEEKDNRLKEMQGDVSKLEDKCKRLKSENDSLKSLKAEVQELRQFKESAGKDLEDAKKAAEEQSESLLASFKEAAFEQYIEGFRSCLAQVLCIQPDFDTSTMGVSKNVIDNQIDGDDEDDVRQLLLQPKIGNDDGANPENERRQNGDGAGDGENQDNN